MSEMKQTPLQFIVVRQGEVVGEYNVTASPVPTPFQTPREVTIARESQRQYIENSVNERHTLDELLHIIFYNAGQAKGDGSAVKPGLANLQPMDWDLIVAKARALESALGGKAE